METSLCYNSVAGHQIATNFCICQTAQLSCHVQKFCSNHYIGIETTVKVNFHRIWIAMGKPLVKRGPGHLSDHLTLAAITGITLSWCTILHWGRDKMADISQTTFSNVFSSMKMFEFRLKFHWSLFLISGLEFTFLSRPSPTSAKWVPLTQENRMLDIEV